MGTGELCGRNLQVSFSTLLQPSPPSPLIKKAVTCNENDSQTCYNLPHPNLERLSQIIVPEAGFERANYPVTHF